MADNRRMVVLEVPWGEQSGMVPPPTITFWTGVPAQPVEFVYQPES
jgi:hypothetical protein